MSTPSADAAPASAPSGEPASGPGVARPFRILFLDSWPRDPARGSGTAVGAATLLLGLRRLGHDVLAPRPPDRRGSLLLDRVAYNVRLRGRVPVLRPDLVVGVDIDGFALRGLVGRDGAPRHAVCLKGVAADEALHERGVPALRLRVLAALERLNLRHATTVIVPSRYSADRVERLYGIDPSRIAIVPEGIDLRHWRGFARAPTPEPRILTVARQYPRKNTRALIAALPAVLARVPAARLRVVGGGPELSALRRQAAALGVAERVDVLGEVSGARVRAELAAAHCFALPSRQEGFGIALLEAMAAGLPVVAARAGAVPEVVAERETALLVEPDDVAGLSAALASVLCEEGLARTLGDAGRRRVQRYDAAETARLFLDAALGV